MHLVSCLKNVVCHSPYRPSPLSHAHTSYNALSQSLLGQLRKNVEGAGWLSILFYLLYLFVFPLQYLGSLIVKRLHGQQSAEEACLKLRVSKQLL